MGLKSIVFNLNNDEDRKWRLNIIRVMLMMIIIIMRLKGGNQNEGKKERIKKITDGRCERVGLLQRDRKGKMIFFLKRSGRKIWKKQEWLVKTNRKKKKKSCGH